MPTLGESLRNGAKQLTQAGVPDPYVDAGLLLEHIVRIPRLMLAITNRNITSDEDALYGRMLNERVKRVPLQYILGVVEFGGASIRVDSRALIPRQETVALLKRCVEILDGFSSVDSRTNRTKGDAPQSVLRVLDLCTGTGALAIAIKRLYRDARVFAGDISPDALALANENERLNGVDICFLEGDLFAPFIDAEPFDLIVSNPPYVACAEMLALQPEVRNEPLTALDGGLDGLDIIRRIIGDAPRHLKPGGALCMEIGYGQAPYVRGYLESSFVSIDVESDINDIPRVVTAYKPRGEFS